MHCSITLLDLSFPAKGISLNGANRNRGISLDNPRGHGTC